MDLVIGLQGPYREQRRNKMKAESSSRRQSPCICRNLKEMHVLHPGSEALSKFSPSGPLAMAFRLPKNLCHRVAAAIA